MDQIALSLGARATVRTLEQASDTSRALSTQLATGRRVNSALDAPTAFFTSRGLQARQAELLTVNDSFASARGTLEAADNGIKALTKLGDQMEALLAEAEKAGGDGKVEGVTARVRGGRRRMLDPGGTTTGPFGGGNPFFRGSNAVFRGTINPADDLSNLHATYRQGPMDWQERRVLDGDTAYISIGRGLTATFVYGAGNDGTTVQDFLNTVNNHESGAFQASIVGDRIEISAPGENAITVSSGPDGRMLTALGINRGIHWNGTAPEGSRIVGSREGMSASTGITGMNNGETRWFGDNVPGADRGNTWFGYGNPSSTTPPYSNTNRPRHGTTVGDFIDTFNGPSTHYYVNNSHPNFGRVYEMNYDAALDDTGRLVFTSTDSRARLTVPTGGSLQRELGLDYNTGTDTAPALLPPDDGLPTFYDRYAELTRQIDALVKDAGYLERNLLDGDDLNLTLNETGTSSLRVRGAKLDAVNLGLDQIVQADFLSLRTLAFVRETVETATSTIQTVASSFANATATLSIRDDFNAAIANTLAAGADNLVLADVNRVGAETLATQTRQSLAAEALTLITTADRSVLNLFR